MTSNFQLQLQERPWGVWSFSVFCAFSALRNISISQHQYCLALLSIAQHCSALLSIAQHCLALLSIALLMYCGCFSILLHKNSIFYSILSSRYFQTLQYFKISLRDSVCMAVCIKEYVFYCRHRPSQYDEKLIFILSDL